MALLYYMTGELGISVRFPCLLTLYLHINLAPFIAHGNLLVTQNKKGLQENP